MRARACVRLPRLSIKLDYRQISSKICRWPQNSLTAGRLPLVRVENHEHVRRRSQNLLLFMAASWGQNFPELRVCIPRSYISVYIPPATVLGADARTSGVHKDISWPRGRPMYGPLRLRLDFILGIHWMVSSDIQSLDIACVHVCVFWIFFFRLSLRFGLYLLFVFLFCCFCFLFLFWFVCLLIC